MPTTVLLPGEVSVLGVTGTPSSVHHVKARNPRVSRSDALPSGERISNNNSSDMVGQTVHGVVDGSFDAGYLVTVRVADTDKVYRGVVFGPGLSIPLNNQKDVTPKLKSSNRDELVPNSSPAAATPASAEVRRGESGNPSEGSAAPSAFRSSFDHQNMPNAGALVYPQQLYHSQGFFPRGFGHSFPPPTPEYGSVDPFPPPRPEYGPADSQFGAGRAS